MAFKSASCYTSFWRIDLDDVPMFKFYTYYRIEDTPNHKVGKYMASRKLFQVDGIEPSGFPEVAAVK